MQQRQPSATVSATSELKPQPPTEEVVGWSALRHGRFRFALNPHLAEDAMKSDDCPNPPSTTSGDAVNAEAEVEGNGRNAVNCCTDTEPRVECVLQCSVVNALSSAYTSSGYPSVVATGTTKGSVYGSFVDLQNPCISSITFPPRESLVIGQASEEALLGDPTSTNTFDTLLHIQWKRGAHLFSSTVTHHSQANGNGSHSAGGSNGSPKTTPQTLSQHLQQFPEGIHGISSSPNMRDLLLHSTIPTTSPQPPGETAPPAPPPPVSPQGSAPLVHSLVAANTFNHLTVYYVVHQDGRFLYSAPIQTISASIGTRKITAQRLFQLGKEEVDPCDEHRAYDYFASGTSSTVNPPTPLSSSSLPPRTRPAGANGTPPIHGKPHFRKGVPFVPCHVPQAAGDVLFNTSTSSFSSSAHFRGARADTRTVQAARLGFVLEPLLLVGNQNGDIFVLSLLEEKIVDRLNYNAGSSQTNSNDLVSTGGKVVCSPVSTIVEVQNGLEKKVVQMVDAAMVAKQSGASELCLSESVCHGSRMDYYQLPPSLFAVGFDHGQVLLVCITTEGGWMLRYFDSSHFGHRPIKCIAPRLPSFFMRLWAHYAPEGSYSSSDQPRELLIASMDTLVVMDEEQHVAAISCCNGTIVLVRLPSLEVLGSVSVTEFNAVGDLLSLTWTCSFPERLLTPDILLASGVDDTISVFLFQDDWRRSEFESSGDYPRERPLCILERQRFHRSWVNHVTTLPLALSERVSGGGMPKYVGTCLVGTSYDSTISFWPMLFDEEDIKEEDSASQVAGSQLESVNATIKQKLFLVDGPTAAHQLHTELVLASDVVGGGTSFFMATICCRGKLKLWSVELKGLDGG